jgi:prophage antirepressor-like protein
MSINQMQVFSFDEMAVRTIEKNRELWFVVVDVCAVLEIGNATMAINRLDEDERTLITIEGASNGLPVNAINESGLYSLILTSRKPEAKRFKKWVTSEVLPAIRKTGYYGTRKSNRHPVIEAAELFHSVFGVVKQVGRNRDQAALAANSAAKSHTGVDLLELANITISCEENLSDDNSILLTALGQFLDSNGMIFRGTFTEVVARLAVIVQPDRNDSTFPSAHTLRRHLERLRPNLEKAGISFTFGGHTNKGTTIVLIKRPLPDNDKSADLGMTPDDAILTEASILDLGEQNNAGCPGSGGL